MGKIAFLYPGQGAQKAGMGKDFYENDEGTRTLYAQASSLLNLDMEELCFTENEYLDQTEYTQAALVTTCLAMTKVVQERGITPDVTAGLSLGEYCAIVAAGGMTPLDAIATVRQRGILMEHAVPNGQGAMAAILGMEKEAVEAVVKGREGVSVANYNCPGQLVITGEKQAVEDACVALKDAGCKRAIPLNVSGPFHSPLLQESGEKLRQVLTDISLGELTVPYVSNVNAKPVTDIGQTKELLAQQVATSVLWQQSMELLIANGVDTFLEIGPGRTLGGFMKKISRAVKVVNIATWQDLAKLEELK